jgi:thioredoxin 1
VKLSEQKEIKLKIEIYTSPTCPYCPAAIRMLQKAVDIYEDAIEVTKVDITTPSGQELASFYNIQATPTIVMNGEVKFRGPPPSQGILFEEIEHYVSKKVADSAAKKRKAQRREIDMMYG